MTSESNLVHVDHWPMAPMIDVIVSQELFVVTTRECACLGLASAVDGELPVYVIARVDFP